MRSTHWYLFAVLAVLLLAGSLSVYAESTSAEIEVNGMDCAKCAARVERVLSETEGIEKVSVDFAEKQVHVTYEDSKISLSEIEERIKELGFEVNRTAAGHHACCRFCAAAGDGG